jgi:hypothetical protein
MGDDAVPPWVLGELPWPDSVGVRVYLDDAEDHAALAGPLQGWYDLAVELLVPVLGTLGTVGPKPRVTGTHEDPSGRAYRMRGRSWAAGFVPDLYQLMASWTVTGPHPGETYDVTIYAFRVDRRRLKLSTSITVPPDRLAGVLPPALDLAGRLAGLTDAAYGDATVNNHPNGTLETRLDSALRRSHQESIDAARQLLRGYEWVTILPKELAPRFIPAQEAFAEVRLLANGGLLLRATENPLAYGPAQARRVFEALRPLLPPGQPKQLGVEDFSLLAMENAAR